MHPRAKATVEDLYRVPDNGKAELIDGEIVRMSPTGGIPGRASGEVYMALRDYERSGDRGYAFPDNVGFVVDLPRRGSFSPDAAFHRGPLQGGKFMEGAPVFAAEVRGESDYGPKYGPKAERDLMEKRADYFAAGTLVVWDVDVLREGVVGVYRAEDPDTPTLYRSGDMAEAEPALPGWSIPVDELLP